MLNNLCSNKLYDIGIEILYSVCRKISIITEFSDQAFSTDSQDEEPLTIEPIGMALPPDAFQLHNLVENYLNALQIAGVLENLKAKWFQDGSWLIRLP